MTNSTTTQTLSPAPLEGVKLAVDFIKQLLAISAQLTTFVSDGIYFLKAQNFHVSVFLPLTVGILFTSILFGLLAFGVSIGQLNSNNLSTKKGMAKTFALIQTLLFFLGLFCIIYEGLQSVPVLVALGK